MMALPAELPRVTMEADEFERMMIDFHRRCCALVDGWTTADAEAAHVYPTDVWQLRTGVFPARNELEKIVRHAGQNPRDWEEMRWRLACLMGTAGFGGLRDLGWTLRNWTYYQSTTFPIPNVKMGSYYRLANGTGFVSAPTLRTIITATGGSAADCDVWDSYLFQAKRRLPEDTAANIGLQLRKLRGSNRQSVIAESGVAYDAITRIEAGYRLPSFETTMQYVHACGADVSEWVEPWHVARDRESRLKGAFGEAARVGDKLRRFLLRAHADTNGLRIHIVPLRKLSQKLGVSYETFSSTVSGKPVSTPEYRDQLLEYFTREVQSLEYLASEVQ